MVSILLTTTLMFAQSSTITGTVSDGAGVPLIGVSVHVKGTSNGVITDIEGKYRVSDLPHKAVLTFSYIGMLTQNIPVAGQSVINVTLKEDTQHLEEVIVVGYGSAKSKDLTAPIDVVKEQELINVPSTSPMAALQGKVAGVNVVNSGTPGSGPQVTIRGLGSFGDTAPLYVVDGMFYNNIDFLNNADIQDLTILKDASASAIYGLRAANGVVIITTKKGKRNQDAKVTYNGYVGIQKASNILEMANSHEYATLMMEINPEVYKEKFAKSIELFGGNLDQLQFGADTDWYDVMTRTAMMTNHSLSIAGGTEKSTYSLGISHLAQDGIMNAENYYRRTNLRASMDYDARQWLRVGFNGIFSTSQKKTPDNSVWQSAYTMPSILPIYDESREEAFPIKFASPEQIDYDKNFYNPMVNAHYNDKLSDTYQVLSNFYAQLNLIPEKLNIRTSYSYNYGMTRNTNFTPVYYTGTAQQSKVTQLSKSDKTYNDWIWDNVATYGDQWRKHSFTGMIGMSMRQEQTKGLSGKASNVPEGADEWKYISLGNTEGTTVSDSGSRYRSLSYFTRLNYNFADKYMLMFTFRADGSSKYNEKWGYFPSIGAAWVVSQEPFMKNQHVFDFVKLRASWGKLGNDKIAPSSGFASIIPVRAVFGTNYALDGFANSSNFSWLNWEVVDETNIGVNFTTLGNRLDADIDWYHRQTKNAVISPLIPMTMESRAGNYGVILNTGIDLSLSWSDKVGKDFTYTIGTNLSWLHNEVKELKDGSTLVRDGNYTTVNKIGEKMNSFYGYKMIGIYQTQEQCAADPIAVANKLQPGDFIYEDVNGDKIIDGADQQVLGSYVPDITYGFNIGFTYKNLDFALTAYGQAGGELWNEKRASRYKQFDYNFDKDFYDHRWTGPGSTNEHPSAIGMTRGWNISDSSKSSYFVESANYFRIQNITLGYSFKNIRMGNYIMPGIRLSLTADRPFTTFKANSFTPELSGGTGIDYDVYPLTSTYTFGVQIDF